MLPLSLLSYEQHIIDKNVHKMGLASSPAQHLMYGISLSGVSYHGEHFEGMEQRCCYDHAVVCFNVALLLETRQETRWQK